MNSFAIQGIEHRETGLLRYVKSFAKTRDENVLVCRILLEKTGSKIS